MTRAELEAGYARGWRRRLPDAYRRNQVDAALIASATLVAATLLLRDSRGIPDWSIALALAFLVVSIAWAVIVTVQVGRAARRPAGDPALAIVRQQRPHAAAADPVHAHDEYAVAPDGDELVVWCFMPLAAHQRAVEGETLVPGVPSYAAAPVERFPGDQAERAQLTAAEWEAEAAGD